MVPASGPRRHNCPTCFHSFTKEAPVGSRIICPMCENFFRAFAEDTPLGKPEAEEPTPEPKEQVPEMEVSLKDRDTPQEGPDEAPSSKTTPDRKATSEAQEEKDRKRRKKEEEEAPDTNEPEKEPEGESGDEPEGEDWDYEPEPEEELEDFEAQEEEPEEPQKPQRAPSGPLPPPVDELPPLTPGYNPETGPVHPSQVPMGLEKVSASVRYVSHEVLLPYREATLREILDEPLSRARVAGVLLLVVFFLGVLSTLSYTWLGYTWADPLDASEEERSNLQVQVQTDNGTAIAEAEVEIRERDITVVTDSLGKAMLPNLPEGDHVVRVSKVGYPNITVAVSLRGLEDRDLLVIMEPGAKDEVLDKTHEWDLPSPAMNYMLATVYLLASLGAFAAASFSLTRRNYRLALGGTVVGIISYGFLIGSVLSLIALLLLIFSPQEFSRKSRA